MTGYYSTKITLSSHNSHIIGGMSCVKSALMSFEIGCRLAVIK